MSVMVKYVMTEMNQDNRPWSLMTKISLFMAFCQLDLLYNYSEWISVWNLSFSLSRYSPIFNDPTCLAWLKEKNDFLKCKLSDALVKIFPLNVHIMLTFAFCNSNCHCFHISVTAQDIFLSFTASFSFAFQLFFFPFSAIDNLLFSLKYFFLFLIYAYFNSFHVFFYNF